jgi:hypothetical protein
MRLNDAEPTHMYGSSSEEMGTGEEDNETEGMGLHCGGAELSRL